MLKITSDGRKAALDAQNSWDWRTPLPTTGPPKVDAASIADIYHRVGAKDHQHRTITDPATDQQPVRGGLQIVFCDCTPNRTAGQRIRPTPPEQLHQSWSAQLEKIRFNCTKQRTTPTKHHCRRRRNGDIAVLIGSTQNMGIGTNVQRQRGRAAPPRLPLAPRDIAQREGRIIRQGNHNDEVSITASDTKSFDAYIGRTSN